MEVLSESKPIARKEHRCDFCRLLIEKGKRYINNSIKDSGEVYTFKMHIHCDRLALKMDMYENNDGLTSSDFQEHIDEAYRNISDKDGSLVRWIDRLETVLNHYEIERT